MPNMDVYHPEKQFICTFSEAVHISKPELIFAPNRLSVSPSTGDSTEFVVTVGVTDKTVGTISLFLGEGAFSNGSEESPEKLFHVTCRFGRLVFDL